MRRLFALIVLSLGLAVIAMPSAVASAHAILDNSVPASGATVAKPPPQIVFDFDEAVEVSLGFVRLFASDGSRVSLPDPFRDAADASIVRVDVPTLDDGTYVASYRVVSVDGHPVEGAITFQVGEGPRANVEDVLAGALGDAGVDPVVKSLSRAARLAGYLALALALGSLLFVLSGVVPGLQARLLHTIVLAAAALGISAIALICLQGAAASGEGLGAAVDWSRISAVLDTRVGHALVVRAVLAIALSIAAFVAVRRRVATTRASVRFLGVLAFLVLPLSYAFGGHPAAASPAAPAVLASVVHVASVATWFGGLALLAFIAPLRETPTVAWFSHRAVVLLPAAVVAGLAQALLVLDEPGDITRIDYGKVLIAKAALVGVMLLAAAVVRRRFLVSGVERLRSAIVVEVVAGLLVLGVTSGLVTETPRSVASAAPFATTLVQDETLVNITVSPARVGSVEIHVIVTRPGGSLDPVASARVRLSLAERDVPPIAVQPSSVGPNHFVAATQIPYAGDWKLDVILVDSDARESLYTTDLSIRP